VTSLQNVEIIGEAQSLRRVLRNINVLARYAMVEDPSSCLKTLEKIAEITKLAASLPQHYMTPGWGLPEQGAGKAGEQK
jgi:hypothetical protein